MALETAGVPTVAVHTHVFARLVRSVASANGMPTMRQAFVPQPVVGRTSADLRAYIEGTDPINACSFIESVIGGLTRPLDGPDLAGLSVHPLDVPAARSRHRRQSAQAVQRESLDRLRARRAADRGARRRDACGHEPRRRRGGRAPASGGLREFWEFTVEKVAVNAVMAGASPAYLPVILAMAASGVSGRSSSTTSQATVALVNGPIRDEIGMNYGIGALGPYSHANATIGRAYGLLSQNGQGGSVPDETYMGSQGNFLSYNATFAENEQASPWEPFHVQHGFKPEDSTVSLFLGGWYTVFGGGPRETWEQKFTRSLQACDPYTGPIIALDPLVARGFVDRGFDTKQKLLDWCVEHARLPAREYWDNQWIQTLHRPRALAGVEPYASMLKAAPDELVRMFRPEDVHVVVVGGGTGAMWKMIGGGPRLTIVHIDPWR